jgi:hypothetical protein
MKFYHCIAPVYNWSEGHYTIGLFKNKEDAKVAVWKLARKECSYYEDLREVEFDGDIYIGTYEEDLRYDHIYHSNSKDPYVYNEEDAKAAIEKSINDVVNCEWHGNADYIIHEKELL